MSWSLCLDHFRFEAPFTVQSFCFFVRSGGVRPAKPRRSRTGEETSSRLNDHLAVAVVTGDQEPFGQIEFQVLTAINRTAQIGFAVFEFTGQIDLRVLATVGALECLGHGVHRTAGMMISPFRWFHNGFCGGVETGGNEITRAEFGHPRPGFVEDTV